MNQRYQRLKPDQRCFGPADSAQIDTGRQAFSVYFDEDGGDSYRFEVSAPDTWSFDGVWSTVGRWLKHQTNDDWSERRKR